MFSRVVSFQTRLVIGALSAVVFASSIGCGKGEITPEDRLRAQAMVRHGVQLAEEGELDSAAIVLEKALRYDSTNAEALYRLGMVYEYLLRPADAETAYRRALRNDSSMAVVHFNLGQICGRSERYDEALEHFEAALRTDTTRQLRALSHYCVGLTHGIQGNFARAADAYADARREDTLFARAYVGEGQELVRMGRYEEAVPALRRAIELDSSLTEAYSHLATTYRMLNRMDEALAVEQAHQRARARSRGQ